MSNSPKLWKTSVLVAILVVFSISDAFGRTEVGSSGDSVQSQDIQKQGEAEAAEYFKKENKGETPSTSGPVASGDHYMAIHFGGFFDSDSYEWSGRWPHDNDPGKLTVGVTYKLDSYGKFADFAIRGDFRTFSMPEGEPFMLDVLAMLLFPEDSSRFPLYFGLGVGPGIFFKQIPGRSYLALSYQMVVGARVFDVIGQSAGLFIEGGLKNHLHLLSGGQFNGFFLAGGVMFQF